MARKKGVRSLSLSRSLASPRPGRPDRLAPLQIELATWDSLSSLVKEAPFG